MVLGTDFRALGGLETLKGSVPCKGSGSFAKEPSVGGSVPGVFGTCLLGAKLLSQLLWVLTSASF